LGKGGMGVVYRAIQKKLNRVVALKVIDPHASMNKDYKERFRQEALSLAKLNHPNIVQVYDYGEFNNQLFIALEFVNGSDCLDLIKEEGRVDVKTALRVIHDSALGLGYAKESGIIHRDIKPANLIMHREKVTGFNADWTVKISDLGLARDMEVAPGAGITQTGILMGTPAYMSPEQADGRAADHRSDIYSLGASLYHFLTGEIPFEGESIVNMLVKKHQAALNHPRFLVPDLPEPVFHILDRMMARKAEFRYQSYNALVKDVSDFLSGREPDVVRVPADESSYKHPGDTTVVSGDSNKEASAPKDGTAAVAEEEAQGSSAMLIGVLILLVALIGGGIFVFNKSKNDTPSEVAKNEDPKNKSDKGKKDLGKDKETDPNPGKTIPNKDPVKKDPIEKDPVEKDPVKKDPEPPEMSAEEKAKLAKEAEQKAEREAMAKRVNSVKLVLASLQKYKGMKLLSHHKTLSHLKNLLDKVGEAEKLTLQLEVDGLIEESFNKGILKELTALYQNSDYKVLAEQVDKTLLIYKQFEVDPPRPLTDLKKVSDAAAKDGAGDKENVLWTKLGLVTNPIDVIDILENFERDFSFSPKLAKAKTKLLVAKKAAPLLDFTAQKGVTFYDGETKLGESPWKGRLLLGTHRIKTRGPDFLDNFNDIVVSKPGSFFIPGHPKPKHEMVQDVAQGIRFWNPMLFIRDWRQTGEWSVVLAKSGVMGEARNGRTSTAQRNLDAPIKKCKFEDKPTWSLDIEMTATESTGRMAEVRFVGPDGRHAVAGFDEERIYIGIREKGKLTIYSQTLAKKTLKQKFQLDWDGELVIVRTPKGIFGTLKTGWSSHPTTIELSVKNGGLLFQNLQAFAIKKN
ncbi:MAG: serine/threonine-protein kinase, partial [Planctomycetota bacterium]|nr:serine/threonine-protein kinase [Planctomycetota bacterium]